MFNMKKVIYFIIIFLIFFNNLYSQNAAHWFSKGEEDYQKSNWDDALYYFKKAAQKNPYYSKALFKIAKINVKLKNYDEAGKYVDKLLKVTPLSVDGLVLQGQLFFKKKEYSKALKIFSKVKKTEPLNYDALNGIAKIHIKKRYFTEAEKYLNKLLKIDKKRVEGYLTYAELYITQNKYRKAEKYLKKGEYFNPAHPDINFYYGLIYDKQNNLKEAKYFYEKAYYRRDDDSDTILNLADVYFKLRDWGKAIEFIKSSLKEFSKLPLLYNKLGLSYQFKNDIDNALDNFKKAYQLNSTDDIIKYHLEDLFIAEKSLYNKDRKKLAAFHFQEAKKFNKNFNNYNALYEYKRGLQLYSENWRQRSDLGLLYKRLGFLEKYLKELKVASMLNPGNQKLKDKYNVAQTFKKKRLSYKLHIEQYKIKKNKIRIFITGFNKGKNDFINNQTGKVLSDSIKNHLNLYRQFACVDNDKDNIDYYFNMKRNKVKKLSRASSADYYAYGTFKENADYLSVSFKLYPVKKDDPIKAFSSTARGKDKLFFLSKDIAGQIKDFFPVTGTIIKIIDNKIIINIGKDEGIKKGDKFEIFNQGGILKNFILHKFYKKSPEKCATAKVIRIDEQIAEAVLDKMNFINKVSINDKVVLVREKSKKNLKK